MALLLAAGRIAAQPPAAGAPPPDTAALRRALDALADAHHGVVACVLTRENADQRRVLDSEPQFTMARRGEAIVRACGIPPRKP